MSRTQLSRKESINAIIFLAPSLGFLLIFLIFPILASFYLSFTQYDIFSPSKWVGFRNYVQHFSDPLFWNSLRVSFYFTLGSVPARMFLALGLAVILNSQIKGISIFRSLFFLPSVASIVAISMLWLWLYNPSFGIFNFILNSFGFSSQSWLRNPQQAPFCLIIMEIWRTVGYWMIIYLAGLQEIPEQHYEAAKIDGANKWQLFLYITFPCLIPVTLFILVMSTIWTLQIFAQVYIMTQGGPANATSVVVHRIYVEAFKQMRFGYASASSIIFFFIVIFITFLYLKILRTEA